MKNIKIGFSKGDSFISSLICILEKNDFSHTYLNFYSDNLERDIIYQSNFLGVNFINKENFLKHSEIIHEISLSISEDLYKKIMRFCIDKAGSTMYDFKGLYGKLLLRIGIYKINPYNDGSKTLDCSELVIAILKEQGYKILPDPSIAGPKDIYNYLIGIK